MQALLGISDPGQEIIRSCIDTGIQVIPIPGACAFINAIVCSGLDTTHIVFRGFLPVEKNKKEKILKQIKEETGTTVIYEAPHKLMKTLESIQTIIGNRYIVLARELTKIHEQFIRGTVKEILENPINIKGEYIIIIQGNAIEKEEKEIENLNSKTLEQHYNYYKKKGFNKREIVKYIAKDRKVNKNEIYQYFINY